jgi:hypothetical protein
MDWIGSVLLSALIALFSLVPPEWPNGSRVTCSFKNNSKMIFKSFKKYLDVDIYEIYNSAKNQYETPNILASEKNNISTKISNFKTVHCSDPDLCICYFC